ncbi:hypothetical protein MLD38_022888 [Melastoma candidum]|uniref:Uncharacterized protein n=1 Tax=Melastoma candidum TaxID=119954 RepID=A0ACB9QNT7_9MYRT|nr:hypothetical protein MLD38_022888 [Melastoma candidum]
MAPSKLRKTIGVVKDKTSIALAKVSSGSYSDIGITIVKATRHDDSPAEEKHMREILSLTTYPRSNVGACVDTIARRLGRTKNWTVAIKALVLVQRLLADGDPSFEQEIFYAARNGTRLLNMLSFRDTSTTNSWDFSAFVRTYALYLDEKLQCKMQARQGERVAFGDEDEEGESASQASRRTTPLSERKIEKIFSEMQQLQQLLERFLACRPTGAAKNSRLVFFALYPIVKESFQVYGELTAIMGELMDRFPALDVPDCMKVYDIFSQAKKQLDDLDGFYGWCKHAGIARSSEYPEVEVITQKKLDLLDKFIRDKKAEVQRERARSLERKDEEKGPTEAGDQAEQVASLIKALPPPEVCDEIAVEDQKGDQEAKSMKETPVREPDLIDLGSDHVHQGENLSLVLFEEVTATGPPMALAWEAFSENSNTADWESALVLSASNLSNQNTTMGGGFDPLVLSGMYQYGMMSAINVNTNFMGSASSVACGADGRSQATLMLPAPTISNTRKPNNFIDPFTPSLAVAPPPYVQMSDIERKQRLMMDEQLIWQQYARGGMTGQLGQAQWQANHSTEGGYGYQRSF